MNLALPWKSIHALGRTMALQSSYLFFVMVPVIVEMYDTAEHVELIRFDLPFSWIALFFAALSISIANTAYFLLCPQLVKEFPGYLEFQQSGRGASYMARQIEQYAPRDMRNDSVDQIADHLFTKYSSDLHVNPTVLPKVRLDLGTPGTQVSQAMFWSIYDVANNLLFPARVVASLFYYLGFTLVGLVFLQKILTVIDHLL